MHFSKYDPTIFERQKQLNTQGSCFRVRELINEEGGISRCMGQLGIGMMVKERFNIFFEFNSFFKATTKFIKILQMIEGC